MAAAKPAKRVRVLLVENQATVREAIVAEFQPETDFEVVGQAGSVAEARELLAEPRARPADRRAGCVHRLRNAVLRLGSFAGRHAELFPFVEQASNDAPGASPLRLAYAIICAAVGDETTARDVLAEGRTVCFTDVPSDMLWMTSMIGYAVLAIELEDQDAAALLFPLLEPFAAEVVFNGATSQGPVAAYLGKLASLLGRHDVADACLRAALDTCAAFGWEYHRERRSSRWRNRESAGRARSTLAPARCSPKRMESAPGEACVAGRTASMLSVADHERPTVYGAVVGWGRSRNLRCA